MIKNIFSIMFFLIISSFIFFVVSNYLSENNKKKIEIRKKNINLKLEKSLENLPLLKNDTQNVIKFNSGYDVDDKIKRNFWNLFKK